MTDNPALAYNRLVIEANRLGRRMKLLHQAVDADPGLQGPDGQLDDLYQNELAELHEKLWGIGAVLALLRETPNAYINPEGMAAVRSEVKAAARIEQEEWAKAILDRVDPPLI